MNQLVTQHPLRVLGISGSARAGSLNSALLLAAARHLPEQAKFVMADLSQLPMYCANLEGQLPESVLAFKRAISEADAILFAATEHNFSVTALMKNALDWGSRPLGQNTWARKTVAVMGASPSLMGTVRAQAHLRQILHGLDVKVIRHPEVFVTKARDVLSSDGAVADGATDALIGTLVQALVSTATARRA
jgi:chromate reductase, NAD(P)H dehydrogenase (quinone)